MIRFHAFVVISLMFCATSAWPQEFTQAELDDMVKSGYAGCLRTQMKLPANEGAPIELIQKYCSCTANRAAVRTTRAEVDAYQVNKVASPDMIEKAYQIGMECRADLERQLQAK